jgi:hypothetical protein
MALSADRNTPHKDGQVVPVPVAANAKCFAGGLAVANATGYGAPGSAALNLNYLGRFEENKDNTGGVDGALTVMVRRKKAFKWKNSGTDAVDQSCLGKVCYIEDDETVSKTNDGGARSQCGVVVGIDSDGVWVE